LISTREVERLAPYAPELAPLVSEDLFWDRITSIEPLADRPVFDLTVAGTHCFVADDVVVHNTQAAYATAVQAARYGAKMMDRSGQPVDRLLVVRAWPVNRYLDELMPDGSPEPVWAVRHRAVCAELLIMDDLGAELDDVGTRFMRKELADLLDERLERRLRTVFTTNHGARVIEERLGERLWSRLQQQSTAVKFLGPDRRAMARLDW
jgi:hypothetical protein